MVARKLLALMLLTGGLSLALAGNASAQQPVIVRPNCAGSGPEQIRPLGPPGTWDCTLNVEYSGDRSDPVNPTSITINAANQKAWMNVIISPSSVSVTPPPDGGVVEVPFTVQVSLTQNAPAFVATQLQLSPSVTTGNPTQDAQANPTQIAVTPGYFNLYNVRLDKKIAEGGPDSSVSFPILIDNFSNGDTRFEFALLGEEGAPSGYQTVVPSPLVLRSKATGGEQTQGQANFQVFTPFKNGYVNRIASIQLQVDSFYAPDTSIEGASSQVSTLTKTRGFYVPGPGAPLAALAVLGAALALTKGRNELGD